MTKKKLNLINKSFVIHLGDIKPGAGATSCLETYYIYSLNYKLVVIGSLVYIVSVPFAFAYTVPVHTREDFLAFALFNWALWAIVKKRDLLFVLFAVAGVLTRETLMLLPLLRLFFGVGSTFKTLAVSFIPVATWFALRIHILVGYLIPIRSFSTNRKMGYSTFNP